MRHGMFLVAVWMLASVMGCDSGPRSPVGFRLPENGDVERGRIAFTELQCNSCHQVSGVEFPSAATVKPREPVVLGGEVHEVRTDGYLVTSIINPSHRLARGPREQLTVDGESRMPDYAREMTVRQLIDLVAFLQSRYTVVPPPRPYY